MNGVAVATLVKASTAESSFETDRSAQPPDQESRRRPLEIPWNSSTLEPVEHSVHGPDVVTEERRAGRDRDGEVVPGRLADLEA